MGRHADSDNLVLLAVFLESKRVIALMAIDCKQSVAANYPCLCMLIKVLQPLQAKLICRPAVLRDCNNPIVRQILLLIPGREVVLALEDDDEGWNSPPCCVDALDNCCHSLFPCCTDFGRPRLSEAVTTEPVDIWPIIKPASSKLNVSSSRIPYLALMLAARLN